MSYTWTWTWKSWG